MSKQQIDYQSSRWIRQEVEHQGGIVAFSLTAFMQRLYGSLHLPQMKRLAGRAAGFSARRSGSIFETSLAYIPSRSEISAGILGCVLFSP
jgi:hypothetical protein